MRCESSVRRKVTPVRALAIVEWKALIPNKVPLGRMEEVAVIERKDAASFSGAGSRGSREAVSTPTAGVVGSTRFLSPCV